MAEVHEGAFAQVVEYIDGEADSADRCFSVLLDKAVGAAVRAAMASDKKAAVTVKLSFEVRPDRKVDVGGSVEAKLPQPEVAGVTLFAGEDGSLTEEDPLQPSLALELPKRPPREDIQ